MISIPDNRELQSIFLNEAIANLSVDSMHSGQPSAGDLRKRHAALQDQIQGLWNTVHLFFKAINNFEGTYACLCSI